MKYIENTDVLTEYLMLSLLKNTGLFLSICPDIVAMKTTDDKNHFNQIIPIKKHRSFDSDVPRNWLILDKRHDVHKVSIVKSIENDIAHRMYAIHICSMYRESDFLF